VLAAGSIAAGYIGVPHALGGHNRLGEWLRPSFTAPLPPALQYGEFAALAEEQGGHGPPAPNEALELTLMGVSSVIAVAGIGLAAFFFLARRDRADAVARRFPGLHRLLLRKYYVDELYDAAVVRPILALSRDGLWRRFDVGVIDGAVNGAGEIVDWGAATLRRLQTGSVRAYAASIFFGVILILGYYFWR
jgi:NADH-quinone oxidoreductase subunit L